MAIEDAEVGAHGLALADGLDPVPLMRATIIEAELPDEFPLQIEGLRLSEIAPFTMHDIADTDARVAEGGLGLPVHVLRRQAPIIKEERCAALELEQGELVVRRLAIVHIAPA